VKVCANRMIESRKLEAAMLPDFTVPVPSDQHHRNCILTFAPAQFAGEHEVTRPG
jgi:hypothetical protein